MCKYTNGLIVAISQALITMAATMVLEYGEIGFWLCIPALCVLGLYSTTVGLLITKLDDDHQTALVVTLIAATVFTVAPLITLYSRVIPIWAAISQAATSAYAMSYCIWLLAKR